MAEPLSLGEVNFVAICQRMLATIQQAPTADQREAAEADFGHFLRMAGAGRLQEWADSHPELHGTDPIMSARATGEIA